SRRCVRSRAPSVLPLFPSITRFRSRERRPSQRFALRARAVRRLLRAAGPRLRGWNEMETLARADSHQVDFHLTPPHSARTQMRVTKRNGEREAVDVNKIVKAVARCGDGLDAVDPMRVALKTIAGLYDGATTRELDELSIRTAASFTFEEPEYSRLAA